ACGPAGAHPGQRSFPTRRSSDLEDFQSDYLAVLPVHRDRAGDTRGSVELERLPPRFERHVTQTDIGGIGLTVHFDTHVLMVTDRSEEHTSELQSRENLVCRLLLE